MLNLLMTRLETQFTQILFKKRQRADKYTELVSLHIKNVFFVLIRKPDGAVRENRR